MTRKRNPEVVTSHSGNVAKDAHRLGELIDQQQGLLGRVWAGEVERDTAQVIFNEQQEQVRAVGARLVIAPPFRWDSIEGWYWSVQHIQDADEVHAGLLERRAAADASIALHTGEPRWSLVPFADEQASFANDVRRLDEPQAKALGAALEHVLEARGLALVGTKWLRRVVGRPGLFEFRVDNDEGQIWTRSGVPIDEADDDDIEADVLVRAFLIFDGPRVILLLSAYDKGDDDSPKREGREIAEADRRATRYRRRR